MACSMFNGRGEHIWRPLQNPAQVEVSAFLDVKPVGFGLLQRDRNPADYQDFEAVYDRRPSLWIEPVGDWGEGAVVLTEIPSDAEIHDNIVAFWRPKAPLPAGAEYRYAYRASWGDGPPAALEQRARRGDAPGPRGRPRADAGAAVRHRLSARGEDGPRASHAPAAGEGLGLRGGDQGHRGRRQPAHRRVPPDLRVRSAGRQGRRAARRADVQRPADRRDLGLPMDSSCEPRRAEREPTPIDRRVPSAGAAGNDAPAEPLDRRRRRTRGTCLSIPSAAWLPRCAGPSSSAERR